MTVRTHRQLANFIWSICNLLRGPYKRNEYRKVILPLTVLRRFDCLLEPTKEKVLKEHRKLKGKSQAVILNRMRSITGHEFYNLSKLDMQRLLDAPNELGPNLTSYINGFSKNVRDIFEKFDFGVQIAKMVEKDLLYRVIQAFCDPKIDLSSRSVDNAQMGYIFEELIRIGAEQANEEAGDHFTPREVIKLMVNLLLTPEKDLAQSHKVKTIYDPACGTGGMLSVAEQYIHELNSKAKPILYGQDWNDESWAVCTSDLLIKKEDPDNIKLADSFTKDGFDREKDGTKITFDYMLANPPFGVEWKQQQKFIIQEHATLGYEGRFGAGLPRVNDGALLFLQHMISKMQPTKKGGSRIGIVFNGSPLFTGDAGGGESNIRQWIFENDWLEAVVALPDQLFYNTGISTYIWILTNRKEPERKGKVQLIDARNFYIKMPKSLGNKRHKIGGYEDGEPDQIAEITRIYGNLLDGGKHKFTIDGKEKRLAVSKVFDNEDFGYRKITVERPLRLNFHASEERIARLDEQSGFKLIASSNKKNPKQRLAEIEEGKKRQEEIRKFLRAFGNKLYKDRPPFLTDLKALDLKKDMRLDASELKAILGALGERDESAQICRDKDGNPEPDPELRDTENVPLKEKVETYFKREVMPHVPDAWIDHEKTKVGYEIPFNRHFYVYEPPRPLEEIEQKIKTLEEEILALLKEVAE
jgi:type I restriction enzyme M protein